MMHQTRVEKKGLVAGYFQQTNTGNSIGSPGMMYMYPPWQYGAAAQYVPVHLQQQQQHKGYEIRIQTMEVIIDKLIVGYVGKSQIR